MRRMAKERAVDRTEMDASKLRLTLPVVLQCCRETPPAGALGAGGACAPHGNLIPHAQFLPCETLLACRQVIEHSGEPGALTKCLPTDPSHQPYVCSHRGGREA